MLQRKAGRMGRGLGVSTGWVLRLLLAKRKVAQVTGVTYRAYRRAAHVRSRRGRWGRRAASSRHARHDRARGWPTFAVPSAAGRAMPIAARWLSSDMPARGSQARTRMRSEVRVPITYAGRRVHDVGSCRDAPIDMLARRSRARLGRAATGGMDDAMATRWAERAHVSRRRSALIFCTNVHRGTARPRRWRACAGPRWCRRRSTICATPACETAAPKYDWLNRSVAVGVGGDAEHAAMMCSDPVR